MEKINNFIKIMREKPFISNLINGGFDVYVVGGATRDLILNKANKDIDLVVTKIDIDDLINILKNFGKVDVVGKSFGVIKFVDNNGVDYDIALPRKDEKNDKGGHKGFNIQYDKNIPIESELIRRDAKFNAMAININTGKLIDPLGGLNDIKNKEISAANSEAFSDDPLRMLRLVGFASRFGFTIEPNTMQMIIDNADRIKEIPVDRIIIELNKIVNKGDKELGYKLLVDTGLYSQIFGVNPKRSFNNINQSKTLGEFMFLIMKDNVFDPADFFKTKLRGDNESYNEIRALNIAYNYSGKNPIEARSIAHNMYIVSPISLKSNILPEVIKNTSNELLSGKYPKIVNDLAVTGQDLMNLGLKGKEIGDTQKRLLINIYANKVKNVREDILEFLNKKSNQENLNETIKGGEYIMYHGTNHDIKKFSDEFVGGINANDQEGPGIYFTSSIEEASRYGKNIYKVLIKPKNLTDVARKTVVPVSVITKLIKLSPSINVDNEDTLSNYDENPIIGLRKAVSSIVKYAENEKDLFQQIWFDFYKNYPVDFVRNMVKFGYDGELIKTKYSINIILYNPNAIVSIEKLDDNQVDNMERTTINEEYVMKDISYSAIVLNERSKNKLIEAYKDKIPNDYRIIADHMTICMGELPEADKNNIGLTVQLMVDSFAIDDKVVAVGVSGYPSNNKYPHITIAVNDKNGGKPVMSNYLNNWEKAPRIRISGIITEIPYKIK